MLIGPKYTPKALLEGAQTMGPRINLEVPFPKKVGGVAFDPDPDWSLEDLLTEISELEKKMTHRLTISSFSAKTDGLEVLKSKNRKVPNLKDENGASRAFVMRVSDEDMEIDGLGDKAMSMGGRFAFGELFFSDNEVVGLQSTLMPHDGMVEGILLEVTKRQQLAVMEEVRSQKMDIETSLLEECDTFASNLARLEKYAETKRDLEKKFDLQYQRKIAEALDNHLTAVQRDHEHKSQLEERRIRDDAIREESQRREKALQEEKVRQEKMRAEAQAKLEAERAEVAALEAERRAAALEAERRAAAEEAKKKASVSATTAASGVSNNASEAAGVSQGSLTPTGRAQSMGNLIRSTETALKMEERRFRIYEGVCATNHALNMDYSAHEKNIKRTIRNMRGSEGSISGRANELLKLINHPSVPQSISIMTFVDMIVAQCNKPGEDRTFYAYARVIVLVTSKVPAVMDLLIAKLNRVCIYTVPKHISYSPSKFETLEAYYKAIGFEEEDGGKFESFIGRMNSCMKLYGALVQTEIRGIPNLHGLEEGWLWLVRFLNAIPPNKYTTAALWSFLEMAGYAMYKRFRNQYMKLLRIIDQEFLEALREDQRMKTVFESLRDYISSKQFLKEPEGRELMDAIQSNSMIVKSDDALLS